MDKAFDRSGSPTTLGSPSAYLVLTSRNGRPLLQQDRGEGIELISPYSFGGLAAYLIRIDFSWTALLEAVPSPETLEQAELRRSLLSQRGMIQNYYRDEIKASGIADDVYEELVELYSRLFPVFGRFLDSHHFLSDNFYSFDPIWSFRDFQSAPDFHSLLEEAFGCYRKDLARAVARSKGSAICTLSHLWSYFTVEQLVELLDRFDSRFTQGFGYAAKSFEGAMEYSAAFGRLSPRLRYILALDLLELIRDRERDEFVFIGLIRDTLVMLESVADSDLKRFRSDRSWDAVHNRATLLASPDKSMGTAREISFPEVVESLENAHVGDGLSLKLLRVPLEFTLAGSQRGLDNCMGSAGYYTKALNGESYCLIIHRAGELEAALEIAFERDSRSWKIVQLNGKGNRKLKDSDRLRATVLELLNGTVAVDALPFEAPLEMTVEELQSRIEHAQQFLNGH